MIRLNMQDVRPIYQQIIDGIKEQVVRGILIEGDQIPSIRQLAGMLTITPNTVSKAYQELEREGVIVSVRGKGNYINGLSKEIRNDKKQDEIRDTLHKACIEWRYIGGTKAEWIELTEKIYEIVEGKKNE